MKARIFIFVIGLFSLIGCEPAVNDEPVFIVPAGFPQPVYDPVDNGMTSEGYMLGRKLFFDPILSRNGAVSCGSCHFPDKAFSDQGMSFSVGIDSKFGKRNTPAIFNLAWQPYFMWDGGVNHIEVVPIAPLTNPLEMDESLANIITKLKNNAEYAMMFEVVFGSENINSAMLLEALSWYMTSIVSYDSKYDKFMRGELSLTPEEESGLALFTEKCASCHTPPLFTDFSFRNNGIINTTSDSGRFRVTLQPSDMETFKVPSLRNIEVTYPYMHDGQFTTLMEVIDHYNTGIQSTSTLDPILEDDSFIDLTENEKLNLVSFLKTLTDESYLNNSYYIE